MNLRLDESTVRRLERGAVYHGITASKLVSILINEHVPIVTWDANGVQTAGGAGRAISDVIEAGKQHKPLAGQLTFLD
jgi:hypothetical protein